MWGSCLTPIPIRTVASRSDQSTNRENSFRTVCREFGRDYRPIDGFAVDDPLDHPSDKVQYRPIFEQIHQSALDRWMGDGNYRPPNLMEVLPLIENGYLPVVDWDNKVIAPTLLQQQYASVFK